MKCGLKDYQLATQIFSLMKRTLFTSLEDSMPEQFDGRFTNVDKRFLLEQLRLNANLNPAVQLYKPFNPFSAALATTYTGNYNYIGLNSRKLNRSENQVENIASLVGSIAHEWGHCLEYFVKSRYPNTKFNHGDNSKIGKDNTFQYWLGRKLQSMVLAGGESYDIQRVIRDFGG